MLAKRIIPCLDVKDGRVVKGINFVDLIDAGDPVEQARVYDREGADELVFLDITATHEARDIVENMVRRVADTVFIPFTVGGGIRTVEDMRAILLAGADKVSVNSAAVRNPEIIQEGARRFGSQCIVVAIDARRRQIAERPADPAQGGRSVSALHPPAKRERSPSAGHSANPEDIARTLRSEPGMESSASRATEARTDKPEAPAWDVFISGGRINTGLDAVEWAQKVESLGAGEILLTSMDGDGTQEGYDVALTRAISDAVNIPVIASGGAGRPEDFAAALTNGGADAVLAASLFHFRQLQVLDVKQHLQARGIPVRMPEETMLSGPEGVPTS